MSIDSKCHHTKEITSYNRSSDVNAQSGVRIKGYMELIVLMKRVQWILGNIVKNSFKERTPQFSEAVVRLDDSN